MFERSKIYVAGHNGLLGSALVRCLRACHCERIVTCEHSELDLTDRRSVFDFFDSERPDYVFLAAGKVGGIVSNAKYPADYLHINLAIQDNVFEACNRFEVKHMVFYGSSCAYPRVTDAVIKEDDFLAGKPEETSIGYAAAKIAGIVACRVYNSQYGTKRFIALVPNTIYGPGDNFSLEHGHVIPALIRRFHEAKVNGDREVVLWGTGRPRREFIYSEDVAEASIFAVRNAERLENRHYNVGTGEECSIKELAEIIAQVTGYDGEIRWDDSKPDGAPRKVLDSSSFRRLGWSHKFSLAKGIELTYKWYVDNLCRSLG